VPLQIDDEIYFGLPVNQDSFPDERRAKLDAMSSLENLWPTGALPEGLMSKLLLQPNSYVGRAFRNPQLSSMPSLMDFDRREVLETEIPAANSVATARAVATMYRAAERAINATQRATTARPDGSNTTSTATATAATSVDSNNALGLSQKALDRCLQPAKPGRCNGWVEEVFGLECCIGAGFILSAPPPNNKEEEHSRSGDGTGAGAGRFLATPNGFGTGGAGGSFGYCDPDTEIAYAYVMNRCGQFIFEDPRDFVLRSKMYEVVQELRRNEGGQASSLLNLEKLNTPHYLCKRYMDAHPELAPL